jgi:hypothetical protein
VAGKKKKQTVNGRATGGWRLPAARRARGCRRLQASGAAECTFFGRFLVTATHSRLPRGVAAAETATVQYNRSI